MALNLQTLLQNCLPIVIEAGKIIKQNWDTPHEVKHKGRIDLVTETDTAVQNFLRSQLATVLPEAEFLGEEDAGNVESALQKPLCWVVDPVDGTTNFVHRLPIVGVSVALLASGSPILGIINSPILAETFYATRGNGAFADGQPIHVSATDRLADSLVATGFPYDIGNELPAILHRLERVLPATQGLRRPGAASLDLAWVACGKLDGFYEDGLKPWDMAAGWLLIEEAQGRVTTFQGEAAGWGLSLLATNGLIHEAMTHLVGS